MKLICNTLGLRPEIPPFALLCGAGQATIEGRLVKALEPVTKVRIFCGNTNQIYITEVPVKDGRPLVAGDYEIAGVPGKGAKIKVDMAGTVGFRTGKLLPTGNPVGKLRRGLWPIGHITAGCRKSLHCQRITPTTLLATDQGSGKMYMDAGADILFIEAQTIDEVEKIGKTFGHQVPLLANQVIGGKTPHLTAKELEQLGYKILIFPDALCLGTLGK